MKSFPNSPTFGLTHYEYIAEKQTESISFSPLLSDQRYSTVLEVIKSFNEETPVHSVAEFGCGSFVLFYKFLLECEFLTTVYQIDIDEERLLSALHVMALEKNRTSINKPAGREPLIVSVFKGNIAHKDTRILESDVVVGIEIIEHLFPNDFDQFPDNIFGFLKPKLAVFTTPNYDYNILFRNNGAFRDADHKFEFTRYQFEDWANKVTKTFPTYSVEIFGIGEPPAGHEDVGYCSQMAVFKRLKINYELSDSCCVNQDYTLIGSYEYFNFPDTETIEDKVMNRVHYTIARYGNNEEHVKDFANGCEYYHNTLTLPLNLFLTECADWCSDIPSLLSILEKYSNNYPIKCVDGQQFIVIENECEIHCCNS